MAEIAKFPAVAAVIDANADRFVVRFDRIASLRNHRQPCPSLAAAIAVALLSAASAGGGVEITSRAVRQHIENERRKADCYG